MHARPARRTVRLFHDNAPPKCVTSSTRSLGLAITPHKGSVRRHALKSGYGLPARSRHCLADRRSFSSSTKCHASPKVLINDMPNQELLVELEPGQAVRYPSFWLRDHCLCSECAHPDTKQRQHSTFDIDQAIKVSSINSTDASLEIIWSDTESHRTSFPWAWLKEHTPFPTATVSASARHHRARVWTHVKPNDPMPETPYPSLMDASSRSGFESLVSQIHQRGFAFIPSTPSTPEATESLLNRIAPIRVTHYGGFWDFTSQSSPIDTAYTNLPLTAHTDTTYFTDPCGLQLFHLLSHTSASSSHAAGTAGVYEPNLGGESTLIDGFAAASELFNLSPAAYTVLATTPIVFTASGSPAGSFHNTSLHTTGSPVLSHCTTNPRDIRPENLTMVRWNNLDRSPLTLFPSHSIMLQWYAAAKLWDEILRGKDFEIEFAMEPGRPFIFDNWRILHGRRSVVAGSKRRVCGGYIAMDDLRAKGRSLGLAM